MIRTTNFCHHLWAILPLLVLAISSVHPDQSSEYFDESSGSVNERPKNYTALAIKQEILFDKEDTIIDKTAKTFLDLVKRSSIFLDTSLFVEEILKNYTEATTLLVCPNKWGKTMNLDMLKTFLEIQVDETGTRLPRENTSTYRLFRRNEIVHDNESIVQKLRSPLLISKKTVLVDRHQGKYPVVFFSLKEAVGDDLTSIREAVRKALAHAFQPHAYLMQKLASDIQISQHLDLFKQMLDGVAKIEDIPDGLILLCHCLEAYFNKKVVLLIDDYDAFVHHLIQSNRHTSDQFKEIVKFMVQVVDTALRRNSHMEFGIATGVLQINAFHWEFHNYTVYVKDRDTPLSEYFGFTRPILDRIFDLYNYCPYRITEAHNWYKGYADEEPSKFFYNPYSIMSYLNVNGARACRDEGKDEALIHDILRNNHAIRNSMLELLSRKVVAAEKRYPYMIEDLESIRVHGRHLMTYLSDKGYLSTITNNPLFNNTKNSKQMTISVAIPNKEITHQIADWMKTYCKREYNIHPLVFNWAGIYLRNLIENQTDSVSCFETNLQTVYKNSTNLKDRINLADEYVFANQEHPVHLILDCLCLRAQQETYYAYEAYYKKLLKADIVAINRVKKHAAIIQMKFKDEIPDRAMAHAENYLHVIDEHADEVDIVNLIGISVSTDFTVRVQSKLVERKPRNAMQNSPE